MSDELIPSESGTLRSSTEGKVDYLLLRDGPLFERWAAHISYWADRRGGKRNWMNASTQEDLDRFRESLARHVEQFLAGDTDEDHAAAIAFNLNGCLYVQERLAEVDVIDVTTRRAFARNLGGAPDWPRETVQVERTPRCCKERSCYTPCGGPDCHLR